MALMSYTQLKTNTNKHYEKVYLQPPVGGSFIIFMRHS